MILELLVTRLDLAGYEVVTARDGHEALKRIPDIHPQSRPHKKMESSLAC